MVYANLHRGRPRVEGKLPEAVDCAGRARVNKVFEVEGTIKLGNIRRAVDACAAGEQVGNTENPFRARLSCSVPSVKPILA